MRQKPHDRPSLKTIKPELRHGWKLLGERSPEIKINTFKNSNAQKNTQEFGGYGEM